MRVCLTRHLFDLHIQRPTLFSWQVEQEAEEEPQQLRRETGAAARLEKQQEDHDDEVAVLLSRGAVRY